MVIVGRVVRVITWGDTGKVARVITFMQKTHLPGLNFSSTAVLAP